MIGMNMNGLKNIDKVKERYYTTGQKKRDTFYFSIENPIKLTLREQL